MSNLAPAAGHAVRLIGLLAGEREAVGVSEIARKLSLNKNMVFRLLGTLEEEKWVYQEPEGGYRLTLVPFQITSRVLRRLSLPTVAEPFVHALWERTGESTYLGVIKGSEVLYLQHLDSVKNVRVAGAVGGSYPLHCTAPGKALLANAGEDFVDRYVAGGLARYTANTVTDHETLKARLAQIRKTGYATDDEEYGAGILCLAAPVFDYSGKAVGAVGSSFSTVGNTLTGIVDAFRGAVVGTASEISSCLGFEGKRA